MTKEPQIPANPQAFPNIGDGPIWDGMTLRDYFAGQALQGLLAGRVVGSERVDTLKAKYCYEMADAMLSKRNEL